MKVIRTYSLEGSLDWILFAAELELLKILVPTISHNKSNVNNEQNNSILYVTIDVFSFICSDINLFLIDYAWC